MATRPSSSPATRKPSSSLTLPASNTAVKAETNRTAGKTGCLYTGPTRIELRCSSGRMNVTSPFTISPAYASCVGANVALPANGVIYVQNVPSTQSASCPGGREPAWLSRSPPTRPPTNAWSATSSCPAPCGAG